MNSTGTFDDGLENFKVRSRNGADTGLLSSQKNLSFNLTADSAMEDVQIIHDVAVFAGQQYSVCFHASGDSAREIGVDINRGGSPNNTSLLAQQQLIMLSPELQRYKVTVQVTQTDKSARLQLNLGGTRSELKFDNIRVVPGSDCSSLAKQFKPGTLYHQYGRDVDWETVLASGNLNPLDTNTTVGFLGSLIDINNEAIEQGPVGSRSIYRSEHNKLRLHTLANSRIDQVDFPRWTRWYQEDGNTQIFRLFANEENTHSDRILAARVETHDQSTESLPKPGVWREWEGRFTILKAEGCGFEHKCSLVQAKGNGVDHWSVMVRLDGDGNVWFKPRRNLEGFTKQYIIAENMEGKSFDILIRDNGLDYEMFLNGQSVGTSQWERTLEIGFRWGMYLGNSPMVGDAIILTSGVRIR